MGPRLNCGRSLYDLPDGRIQVSAKATERLLEAVRAGKRGMSVEFYSMKESRNRAGVREIQPGVCFRCRSGIGSRILARRGRDPI